MADGVITECTHGMPTPASCIECMAEGPVASPRPAETQMLNAERWIEARFPGQCARRREEFDVGARIGYVEDVGWCCTECAR